MLLVFEIRTSTQYKLCYTGWNFTQIWLPHCKCFVRCSGRMQSIQGLQMGVGNHGFCKSLLDSPIYLKFPSDFGFGVCRRGKNDEKMFKMYLGIMPSELRYSFRPVLDHESLDCGWFPLKSLHERDDLHPTVQILVRDHGKKVKKIFES